MNDSVLDSQFSQYFQDNPSAAPILIGAYALIYLVLPLIAVALARTPLRRPGFWGWNALYVALSLSVGIAAFLAVIATGSAESGPDPATTLEAMALALGLIGALGAFTYTWSARRFIDMGQSRWLALLLIPVCVALYAIGYVVWTIVLGVIGSVRDPK